MKNTEIVKQGYENFGSGNIDGLIDMFAEDIKWTIPDVKNSPFESVTNGRENVREFFGTLGKTEEFTSFEPKEFITEGNKVVVLGHSSGKIITTGRNFETDWVHIFTVNDGKITNFLEFFDTAAMENAYQRSTTA
ncbi:MAG: nuclear transport factor 2 family protein [Aridibacter sp.]|jgi:ketosteroid isomerase-like protein|nr:nuclear transport factor 2 family protein [Acidobacteriota bacterium]